MLNTTKLLELMENNARFDDEKIAIMLDSTKEEVKAEIKRLEKEGIIKGYRALIRWEKTDTEYVNALIEVKVTPQRDTGYDDIAKLISSFDEVESVHLMAGTYDLAVTVSAPTMSEVAMFVRKRLSTISGVLSAATHFTLTKYKEQDTIMFDEFEEIDERGGNVCE